jgi:phage tail tape-measure protein
VYAGLVLAVVQLPVVLVVSCCPPGFVVRAQAETVSTRLAGKAASNSACKLVGPAIDIVSTVYNVVTDSENAAHHVTNTLCSTTFSIAGGLCGAPFGPPGVFIGNLAGSIFGGFLGTLLVPKIE